MQSLATFKVELLNELQRLLSGAQVLAWTWSCFFMPRAIGFVFKCVVDLIIFAAWPDQLLAKSFTFVAFRRQATSAIMRGLALSCFFVLVAEAAGSAAKPLEAVATFRAPSFVSATPMLCTL